jgi:integrase
MHLSFSETGRAPARRELTDRFLKSVRPGGTARDVRDTLTRGLIARILPSGVVVFAIRYRHLGQQRRFTLGQFPTLSLSQARVKAARALLAARDGHDPAESVRELRRRPSDTVDALAADYLKRHARPRKRSAGEDERTLERDVLPFIGSLSVKALTRRDVRRLLERVVDRGAPIMANRTLSVVRKMLNFAVDHDWIEANPAARIGRPAEEQSRERVLTDDELRRLWRLLHRPTDTQERPAPGRRASAGAEDDPVCPIGPRLAALVKTRLLTAQRGGEVSRMRWQDIEPTAGWWTIPAEDSKNGRPHRVPLSDKVVAILRDLNTGVHPGKTGNSYPATGYVFAGEGESQQDRAKKAPGLLAKRLGLDFRGHDLRRTAATRMAEAGIPREHIAHVLGHVDRGPRATRVYDRHHYDAEKRAALEAWERALFAVVDGDPS